MAFHDSNTVARFEQARLSGADVIELDLRASSDGVPFVIHDSKLQNMTRCFGKVSAHSSESLRRCQVAGTDQRLNTFEEVLQWAAGRVVLNAEFKDLDVIRPAIDLVRKYNAYDWVFFQCKDDPARYHRARSHDKGVALLFAPKGEGAQKMLDHLLSLKDENLVVIEMHPEVRTPENIRRVTEAGKITLEDAWHFGAERDEKGRHSSCKAAFEAGIRIAISDVPEDCVKQRDAINGPNPASHR